MHFKSTQPSSSQAMERMRGGMKSSSADCLPASMNKNKCVFAQPAKSCSPEEGLSDACYSKCCDFAQGDGDMDTNSHAKIPNNGNYGCLRANDHRFPGCNLNDGDRRVNRSGLHALYSKSPAAFNTFAGLFRFRQLNQSLNWSPSFVLIR